MNTTDYLGFSGQRVADPKLDIQEVNTKEQSAGTCGGVRWRINWVLANAVGQKGVIAQQVTWSGWYKVCGKRAKEIRAGFRKEVADDMLEKKEPFDAPNLTEYWETDGNTVKKSHDEWIQSEYGGICTEGKITIEAVAMYFPGRGMPQNAKPGDEGGHPFSGKLPSIVGHAWPNAGEVGPSSAPKKRKMTISWNCCDGNANKTKVR